MYASSSLFHPEKKNRRKSPASFKVLKLKECSSIYRSTIKYSRYIGKKIISLRMRFQHSQGRKNGRKMKVNNGMTENTQVLFQQNSSRAAKTKRK